MLKKHPYAPAILYLVGGNYPSHPLQENYFADCLEACSQADIASFTTCKSCLWETFLKGLKLQNSSSPQFETATLLKQRLLRLKKYKRSEFGHGQDEGSFEDSFAIEDEDSGVLNQMTQIMRQPAAVLKKDVVFSHNEILRACAEGDYDNITSVVSKFHIEDLSHVRGFHYEAKLLNKKVSTEDWNPLLHALYNNHSRIVEFMCKTFGPGPIEQMIYDPHSWGDNNMEEEHDSQCFGIQIAI